MIKKRSTPPANVGKARDPDLVEMGKRLQSLAAKAGFKKQAPLARAAKIPPGTLNSYMIGDRRMSYDNARALAVILGTTVDYLFSGKNLSTSAGDAITSQRQIAAPGLKIRLFRLRDVTYFRMVKNKLAFDWSKMITLDPPELILGQAYAHLNSLKDEQLEPFAVLMDGDQSMEPRIQRDARLIIHPAQDCQPGKPVLAVFESMGIAVIRTYIMERGADRKPKKIMRALDGVNPDMEMDDDAGDWCWPVGLIITPP